VKQTLFRKIFLGTLVFFAVFLGSTAIAASLGVIDPLNAGNYKAAFLDSGVVSNTAINFGKFTTESAYNITVSDTQLRGYAWGSSVGWMVMNCADTTSGCVSANGSFKVANDGTGKLSGYAWGENTGWINFGPFTDTSISSVKIDTTTGNFGGTLGTAGYAWSQNYGWIVFDCTNTNTCVNTDWRPATGGGTGGGTSGGGGIPSGPTMNVEASNVVCDTDTYLPHWGKSGAPAITASTAATYVANSNGHCHLTAGQYYQWGHPGSVYDPQQVYGTTPSFISFGPTDATGSTTLTIPLSNGTTTYPLRTVLQVPDIPFTYPAFQNNDHPISAEFYCSNDGINYDNIDYITNPVAGSTYHCVSFNTTSTGVTVVTPPSSTVTITASAIFCDTNSAMPHWGAGGGPDITATTAANFVANSGGHCRFNSGVSFQWGDHTAVYPSGLIYGPAAAPYVTFGPTDATGSTTVIAPFNSLTPTYHMRELLEPPYDPFSYEIYGNNLHAVGSEFYCDTDVQSYDDYDWILHPQKGGSYYCIGFNQTGSIPTTPVVPPNNPDTPTPPNNPSTPPSTPPSNPGTGTGTGTGPGGNGNGGNTGGNGGVVGPTQPPTGTTTEPPNNPAQSTNEPGLIDTVVSSVGNIIAPIGSIISSIGNSIVNIASNLGSILSNVGTATGTAIAAVASAVGIISTIGAGLATLLIANPFALSELLLLPLRLWDLLLVFFGYKKRKHPWGTVYDSVTKQPIDPAYVVLMDLQGNEVSTSITDIDGRYGFSVPAGTYKIMANKTNYEFPSKKLFGKTSDELYDDLYFGEEVTTKEEGEVIIKNIPLDQLKFDWNEFAKKEQKRLSYYKHSELTIARISNFFFWLGFIFAAIALATSHTTYNGIIFVIYILLFIIRRNSKHFQPKGSVIDAFTNDPLPFAIVHVLSKATGQEVIHKVADRLGNYYCLVPNGTYQVVIDRKNPDASYTKIPVPEPVVVTKGYLKQEFKV
jgi:hypothetical protein